MYSMAHDSTFSKFSCAHYATDVRFQKTNRQTGIHDNLKRSFSAKHSKYSLRTEFSVITTGFCIHPSSLQLRSVSDISIFKNIRWHRKALKKTELNYKIEDEDSTTEKWATLVDKAYQGIGEYVRAVHPKNAKRSNHTCRVAKE